VALEELAPDVIVLTEFRSTPPSQNLAETLDQVGYEHQTSTVAQAPRSLPGEQFGTKGEDEQTSVINDRVSVWFDHIHEAGWRDAFRVVHGSKRKCTWHSPGYDNGFRLDQASVSPQLAERNIDVRHVWPLPMNKMNVATQSATMSR